MDGPLLLAMEMRLLNGDGKKLEEAAIARSVDQKPSPSPAAFSSCLNRAVRLQMRIMKVIKYRWYSEWLLATGISLWLLTEEVAKHHHPTIPNTTLFSFKKKISVLPSPRYLGWPWCRSVSSLVYAEPLKVIAFCPAQPPRLRDGHGRATSLSTAIAFVLHHYRIDLLSSITRIYFNLP